MEGGGGAKGLGVTLASGAIAYAGSSAFCSRPATLDAVKVRAATPEAVAIRRDGVQAGSARWSLLQTAMHERMLRAADRVAKQGGFDLIVRHGDIADARGLEVADVTAAMIAAL